MAINNYTELTIPQGSVNKIEDSNGNIIWGSQSKYPYRILEYVDIPAGAYISTNDNGNNVTAYYIDANWNVDGDTLSGDAYPFGSIYYNGTTYFRYHLILGNISGMRAASAAGTLTNLFNASDSNNRYVIELNYHTYRDGKVYLDNVDKGIFSPTSGTNTGVMYLGGRRFNNNGTVNINNYPHKIRVWSMKQKTGTNSDTYFYPVQRRRDGKVGLLKIYNNGQAIRFCATDNDVELIAGPTVQEYFEGTSWPT